MYLEVYDADPAGVVYSRAIPTHYTAKTSISLDFREEPNHPSPKTYLTYR